MASRVQDDCHSTAHFAGARAKSLYAEEEVTRKVTQTNSESDSDSDSDSYSESSSDDDVQEEYKVTATHRKKIGDKYERPSPYRRVRYDRRRVKGPVESVTDGVAGMTVGSVNAVLNTAMLRPDRAADNIASIGSNATQTATLGAYQDNMAYAKAGAKSAPETAPVAEVKKAGAGFKSCFMADCPGCVHPDCQGKRAGASEGEKKAAGCHKGSARIGSWSTTVAPPRHVHGKKSHMSGGSYQLKGAHSMGKCASCGEGVKRAGGSCSCGNLRSVPM